MGLFFGLFVLFLLLLLLLELVDIVDVLLMNVPSGESYERSLMHREPIN